MCVCISIGISIKLFSTYRAIHRPNQNQSTSQDGCTQTLNQNLEIQKMPCSEHLDIGAANKQPNFKMFLLYKFGDDAICRQSISKGSYFWMLPPQTALLEVSQNNTHANIKNDIFRTDNHYPLIYLKNSHSQLLQPEQVTFRSLDHSRGFHPNVTTAWLFLCFYHSFSSFLLRLLLLFIFLFFSCFFSSSFPSNTSPCPSLLFSSSSLYSFTFSFLFALSIFYYESCLINTKNPYQILL